MSAYFAAAGVGVVFAANAAKSSPWLTVGRQNRASNRQGIRVVNDAVGRPLLGQSSSMPLCGLPTDLAVTGLGVA